MLLEATDAFPPLVNKKMPRATGFVEIVLRKRLRDYKPLLDKISGAIRPDQKMCNFICGHPVSRSFVCDILDLFLFCYVSSYTSYTKIEQIAAAQNVSPPYDHM